MAVTRPDFGHHIPVRRFGSHHAIRHAKQAKWDQLPPRLQALRLAQYRAHVRRLLLRIIETAVNQTEHDIATAYLRHLDERPDWGFSRKATCWIGERIVDCQVPGCTRRATRRVGMFGACDQHRALVDRRSREINEQLERQREADAADYQTAGAGGALARADHRRRLHQVKKKRP